MLRVQHVNRLLGVFAEDQSSGAVDGGKASHRLGEPADEIPPGVDIVRGIHGEGLRPVGQCFHLFPRHAERHTAAVAGVFHQVIGLPLGVAAAVVAVEVSHVVVGFHHDAAGGPFRLRDHEHTKRDVLKGSVRQLQPKGRADFKSLPLIAVDAHVHEGGVQFPDIDLPDLHGVGAAALVRDGKRALQDVGFREGPVPGCPGQAECLHLAVHGLPVFFAYCVHSCLLKWRRARPPGRKSASPRRRLCTRRQSPRCSR